MPFCSPIILQFLIHHFHIFPLNIPLVRAKTARETARNVHEFMNQGFLLILSGHFVVNLGDDFDGVGWWKVQHALPNLAQTVDAGDGAACFGASAADAEDELGHDMVEFAFLRQLVNLFFDFWGIVVFYRHCSIFLPFTLRYVVWVKKLSASPTAFLCFPCLSSLKWLVNRLIFSRTGFSSMGKRLQPTTKT